MCMCHESLNYRLMTIHLIFKGIDKAPKIIFVSYTSTIGKHFTRAGYCVVEISRMYSATGSNNPGKDAYLGYGGTSSGNNT